MPTTRVQAPVVRQPALYVYDPRETLEQFRSRQQHAYAAGRRAWRERVIKAQLLPFYDALVQYVGQNQYAWVKEQTLADEFGVHVGTIKRWLAKLEDAGLIRRQRRFATTSLTFLTAYDQNETNTDNLNNTLSTTDIKNGSDGETGGEDQDYRQSIHPPVGSRNAPTFGAFSCPDPFKNSHLRLVGGEIAHANKDPVANHETSNLLEREGVADYHLLPALHHKSRAELEAVSAYLDRQRNVQSRPRLFAWLASRDFGAQLLRGRYQNRHTPRRPPPMADDPRTYVNGPLADLVQWQMGEGGSSPPPPTSDSAGQERPGELPVMELWQEVLSILRACCPLAEWATWLQNTALLDVTAEQAIVGTPNVFARDTIRDRYLPQIHEALRARLPALRQIEVVIGS